MPTSALESDNPLTQEESAQLGRAAVEVARRLLVGRRFLDLYGPLGLGVQAVPNDDFGASTPAADDVFGEQEAGAVFGSARRFRAIPLIYKDFLMHWRDLEAARGQSLPLDVSAAVSAASLCAQKEDELIFHGDAKLGVEGLMNIAGRQVAPLIDWTVLGNGLKNAIDAIERLQRVGQLGPYAMVLSPRLFGMLHRVFEKTGVLEIQSLRDLTAGRVWPSSQLKGDAALVVSTGRQNLDLAMAFDLTIAYLGPSRLNHPFRVVEAILPRIKRPDSLCTLERS